MVLLTYQVHSDIFKNIPALICICSVECDCISSDNVGDILCKILLIVNIILVPSQDYKLYLQVLGATGEKR